MWPGVIMALAPERELDPGIAQTGEQDLIETFIAKAAIEALDECILRRLVWRNVMPVTVPVL